MSLLGIIKLRIQIHLVLRLFALCIHLFFHHSVFELLLVVESKLILLKLLRTIEIFDLKLLVDIVCIGRKGVIIHPRLLLLHFVLNSKELLVPFTLAVWSLTISTVDYFRLLRLCIVFK